MKFEFVAGNLALDFANSVHDHGSADPQDDLKTCAELLDWGRQAGLLSPGQCRKHSSKPSLANLEFERTLDLRDALYEIFVSQTQGRRAPREALRRFNRHFREAMADASLQSAGSGYGLTCETNGNPLRRIRWEITRSAVSLLTSDRLKRVAQCAGESCTWLFLDTSRNGLRRWCDMQACGNRAKVRRFRERNAAD